jgi:hypothetical protein
MQKAVPKLSNTLTSLESTLNQVSTSLNQLKKAYRRTLIKAVVITGSVTLGIGAIVVVMVLIFG